jgi:hypothetical protein
MVAKTEINFKFSSPTQKNKLNRATTRCSTHVLRRVSSHSDHFTICLRTSSHDQRESIWSQVSLSKLTDNPIGIKRAECNPSRTNQLNAICFWAERINLQLFRRCAVFKIKVASIHQRLFRALILLLQSTRQIELASVSQWQLVTLHQPRHFDCVLNTQNMFR